jgi:guanine nucleotide-binding protein G(I)/G(S)/G(T) subunit beta-1
MSNDVSPEAMQGRIQQARREAETLKDRIKRKKDDLADTTRKSTHLPSHESGLAHVRARCLNKH